VALIRASSWGIIWSFSQTST